MILGIDEAGRGPWAGPLVVGAVVLGGAEIDGLTDSKKLSKKRREALEPEIMAKAAGYGLGWVSAAELDEIGMSAALVLASKRAVEQITVSYHEIIIDGTINFLKETSKGQYVTTMPKADLLIPSVSAASILAKVARDRYMTEQDELYPGYKFGSHAGYGTAAHRAAIDHLGVTPLHRMSFAPLQKHAKVGSGARVRFSDTRHLQPEADQTPRLLSDPARSRLVQKRQHADILETTKSIGDRAEAVVEDYLMRQGHEIRERNWKTKYCEIDIVSHKDGTLYFTEVKYRKTAHQGGGMAAITKKKLNQMKFAANYYAQAKKLQDVDMLLVAVAASGDPPQVDQYIELT